jgi:hypothetical protein
MRLRRLFPVASCPLKTLAAMCLCVTSAPWPCLAQTLPEVPPIPAEERLLERNDLIATLKAEKTDLTAGEFPALTLVLTNNGRRPLRVTLSDLSTLVRAFDADGEEIQVQLETGSPWSAIGESSPPAPLVRTLPVLPSGRSGEISLNRWRVPNGLPVGDYVVRVTYVNRLWSPRTVQDRDAGQMWEGDLTATIAVHVHRPADPAWAQRLIEQVRDGDVASAEVAMRVLGLGRVPTAVDAIVERFERDYSTLPVAVESLAYIGTPHAARALGSAYARVPIEALRRGTVSSGWSPIQERRLIRGTGCDALALDMLVGPSQISAQEVRLACRDAADRLRAELQSRPPGQALTAAENRRREWARSMLDWLAALPPLATPTAYPTERFGPPPIAERLPAYVAAIIGLPGENSEYMKVELGGIARFGTPDTFTQLRTALATASDERASYIPEALLALTFDDEKAFEDSAQQGPRWDRWWREHGRQSREQWALEALARPSAIPLPHAVSTTDGAPRAAEYLITLDRGRYERALVTHPSWRVRVATAVTLAPNDPRYAAALLLRELENRYLGACEYAGSELASLTGTWFPFKCDRTDERKAAAAYWAQAVSELH